ncbi:thioredoxin-like protein [Pyronema omphalodes]|nr:thioredoxin-like protein [Pyronema omphalodes]
MDTFAPVKDEASRRHPEDSDSNASDIDDTNLDDINLEDTDSSIPGHGNIDLNKTMPLFNSSSKLLAGSYQTGVKGVIADAQSFESARRKKSNQSKPRNDYQFVGYATPQELDARTPLNPNSSEGESDDDEFVRAWRKNRLNELRTGASSTRRRSPSKRKYGSVETVDAAGYLDAIERVSAETTVVVTIFDDQSEESSFVEDCINTLSKRHVTTRFIKLHHLEAEMDAKVVPAVLAYKGGELFANLIRIVDEIPPGRNLSTESLELVLRRANVLVKDA